MVRFGQVQCVFFNFFFVVFFLFFKAKFIKTVKKKKKKIYDKMVKEEILTNDYKRSQIYIKNKKIKNLLTLKLKTNRPTD